MKFIIHNFHSEIELTGKAVEAEEKFQQYQKDGNTEENMFRYIYDMEEAHKLLQLPVTKDRKDELQSAKLREEGNKLYKIKKLRNALEKYNECIFSAPHPKLSCGEKEENKYTPLALGYGNRSAVLFALEEYEICIRDIDHALNFCNSKITQLKLEERKVKCLIATERYEEAKELLKNSQILINTLKLEEKVNEYYKNSELKLSQQCVQRIKSYKHQSKKKSKYDEIKSGNASTSLSRDDLIFAYNNPTPPSLDDEPNPNISAFSRALKLQYSADQGKHVVATRDIKPGEVILVEKAYASCIQLEEPNSQYPQSLEEPNSSRNFCHFCLARCAAPLPCPECINVVFCSEECRSKGWEEFHRKECPVYALVQNLESSLIMAYRVISSQSLEELKGSVSQFKKDIQNKSPLEQIINENQIIDSESYRSLYFMEGNIKTMNARRVFRYAVRAFMMTQMLIKSSRFFVNRVGDKMVPDDEDIIFIGSLLIRHLLGVSCNNSTINETHVKVNDNMYAERVRVGGGIFVAQNLFNHSCFPSAFLFTYGNVGVCRATRFIPSEAQVYLHYSDIYYCEPDRNVRRKNLSNLYAFNCNCEVCVSNCKLEFSDLQRAFTGSISKIKTNERRVSRNGLENTASLKSELATLVKRNKIMIKKLTTSFDIKGYLDLALETIEFFDRYIVVPDPMYIHLSGIFLQIFDREMSCRFIPKTKPIILDKVSEIHKQIIYEMLDMDSPFFD